MNIRPFGGRVIFKANTMELALPGHWCCSLEGEATLGCIGGEH